MLGVLGVLAVCALSWPYTVDDAFIVARYAQNLVLGHGYGMNPDVPSDGITGPLWIVPSLLAVWLGGEPLTASKLVGAACALLAAWLVVRWAHGRAIGGRAAWASAAAIACLPDVGTWSVSGLETGAALLGVTVLAIALLDRQTPRFGLAVVATMALAWLRPELAPCVLVLWLGPLMRSPARAARWLLGGLAGALTVIVWRVAMFGDALPLSARAKPADLGHGAQYALLAIVLMTSIAGTGLAVLGAWRGRRDDRFLLAAIAAHVAAVVLAGGDWMPGARLMVPIAGLYALLVGRGVARLSLRRVWLAAGCLALAVAVPLIDLAVRVPELRATAAARDVPAAHLGRGLRDLGKVVAVLDVGYLGYVSRAEIVDLGGLTDPHIARLPGGHIDKRIDEQYLRQRDPDVIVLHSSRPPKLNDQKGLLAFSGYPVEHRVAAMPWVRDSFRVLGYVELHDSYGYVVLERVKSVAR
jgi:hypothetical protein